MILEPRKIKSLTVSTVYPSINMSNAAKRSRKVRPFVYLQDYAGDLVLIAGSGILPREGKGYPLQCSWASFVTQLVKNPLPMQATWVRFLGWEDPLEKAKATHSSTLA